LENKVVTIALTCSMLSSLPCMLLPPTSVYGVNGCLKTQVWLKQYIYHY